MHTESTIEDILNTVERFRILCVGRSGVGKSSLINRVFGIDKASISDFKPGEADINQEFVSNEENKYFVLHDSKGFEPGDHAAFDVVDQFIRRRQHEELLKNRLHAIWLCTETPTAGGRVFEAGDEKLLTLAHETGTPVVIVFTQYDRLIRTKKAELEEEEEDDSMDGKTLDERSKEEARKALQDCVQSLSRTMERLNTPFPHHIDVSIRSGYGDNIVTLVEITRNIVRDRLEGDAWIAWAIAQRASLSVKVEACIDKGVNYYYRALAGSAPAIGKMLLWQCLVQVHQDIITCWNFKDKDEILKSDDFKQLMLYLVQDLQDESRSTPPPDIDRISQFVTLVTTASAPIAPPAAILGLTYLFVTQLYNAVVDNIPSAERVLMAYTVDLISVLKSLFDFTLQPRLAGKTNWEVLKEAFEAYERTSGRQHIHDSCRSAFQQSDRILDRDSFRRKLKDLLDN